MSQNDGKSFQSKRILSVLTCQHQSLFDSERKGV